MTSSIFYTCNTPPFLPPLQPLFLILSFLFIFSPLSCGRGTCFLSEQTSRVHRGVGGVGLLCRRLVLLKQIPRISVTQQPRFGTPLKADLVVTGVQGPGERPRQDYSWMFFTFVLFFYHLICIFFFFLFNVSLPQRGFFLEWNAQTHLVKSWISSCPLLGRVFSFLSLCDWAE